MDIGGGDDEDEGDDFLAVNVFRMQSVANWSASSEDKPAKQAWSWVESSTIWSSCSLDSSSSLLLLATWIRLDNCFTKYSSATCARRPTTAA